MRMKKSECNMMDPLNLSQINEEKFLQTKIQSRLIFPNYTHPTHKFYKILSPNILINFKYQNRAPHD